MSGCIDRERPGVGGPDLRLTLNAEILEPRTAASVEAGRPITIRVRAHESNGRLGGVGFSVHQFGPGAPLVGSGEHRFSPQTETTHTFSFRVPPHLQDNTQLDIRAIAFGPAQESVVSAPQSVVVLACSPSDSWCQ